MNIIEITNSNTNETDALVDLLHQQMMDINSKKSRAAIESAVKNALKPESRVVFFLAKQNENPVGAAFINICSGIESGGDYVWLNEIQILPRYRGNGLGSELLNHVINWSKCKNIKSILSVSGTNNSISQGMFKSAGFEIEDIKWIKR